MADDHVINVCFHGVGKPTRELEPGEAGYWISEDQFNRILDEVVTWPAVRLSFDDGNTSDLEIALPALLERGLRADFFALAGRLDMPGALDPDGVRELHRYGMRIGTHGMRHRSWRGMDADTSHDELVAARDALGQRLVGRPSRGARVRAKNSSQCRCPGLYDPISCATTISSNGTPICLSSSISARAPSTSRSTVRSAVAWSRAASIVASGIVLTVSGPISSSM
jgi:hypothetical protein